MRHVAYPSVAEHALELARLSEAASVARLLDARIERAANYDSDRFTTPELEALSRVAKIRHGYAGKSFFARPTFFG